MLTNKRRVFKKPSDHLTLLGVAVVA